jgi:hypothetical protein
VIAWRLVKAALQIGETQIGLAQYVGHPVEGQLRVSDMHQVDVTG